MLNRAIRSRTHNVGLDGSVQLQLLNGDNDDDTISWTFRLHPARS